MSNEEGKTPNKDSNNQTSPDYQPWLKSEFEQNFLQLRSIDDKILGLIKFYVTMIVGLGSAAIAIMGLENLEDPYLLVGLLLLGTSVAGGILLVWMITLRGYFVTCARQLNAIRSLYSEYLPTDKKKHIVQPTDSSYPPLLHKTSSHYVVMVLMIFLNSILALLGTLGLMSCETTIKLWQKAAISATVFVSFILFSLLYVQKKLNK